MRSYLARLARGPRSSGEGVLIAGRVGWTPEAMARSAVVLCIAALAAAPPPDPPRTKTPHCQGRRTPEPELRAGGSRLR